MEITKPKHIDAPPPAETAPGEFGPITYPEYMALPEDVRRRRAQRGYQKFLMLKGNVHLNIDIADLLGCSRR